MSILISRPDAGTFVKQIPVLGEATIGLVDDQQEATLFKDVRSAQAFLTHAGGAADGGWEFVYTNRRNVPVTLGDRR